MVVHQAGEIRIRDATLCGINAYLVGSRLVEDHGGTGMKRCRRTRQIGDFHDDARHETKRNSLHLGVRASGLVDARRDAVEGRIDGSRVSPTSGIWALVSSSPAGDEEKSQ